MVGWQRRHGRRDLPWQGVRDPYRVWVSEIMLQQTQAATVAPRYAGFVGRFPAVGDLAAADLDDVLSAWSGLGYYARARNLHAAAKIVASEHGGRFPRTPDALRRLPGIGRSTAGAIMSLAYRKPFPILDGNAKRVLARCFGVDAPIRDSATTRLLWRIAEREQPARLPHVYAQGMMDLGALVCTPRRPACDRCPLAGRCLARKSGAQERIPTRSAAVAKPEFPVTLVVATCGRHVLLVRRPTGGYWGGLWTPPAFGTAQEWESVWESRRLGRCATVRGPLPKVGATFTHMRLKIAPLRVDAKRRFRLPGARWVPLDRLDRLGLPAPVTTLLRSIDGQSRGPD